MIPRYLILTYILWSCSQKSARFREKWMQIPPFPLNISSRHLHHFRRFMRKLAKANSAKSIVAWRKERALCWPQNASRSGRTRTLRRSRKKWTSWRRQVPWSNHQKTARFFSDAPQMHCTNLWRVRHGFQRCHLGKFGAFIEENFAILKIKLKFRRLYTVFKKKYIKIKKKYV